MRIHHIFRAALVLLITLLAGGGQLVLAANSATGATLPRLNPPGQAGNQQQAAVVNAVMFWSQTCPHCHDVLNNVLPPLKAQYGEQFNLLLIEIRTSEDREILRLTAALYDIRGYGIPFLVIGDTVLMGAGQIPASLPGLIETHLAGGGLSLPEIPGLERGIPFTLPGDDACPPGAECAPSPAPAEDAPPPLADGHYLAIAVMAGMVIALAYTGIMLVRYVRGLSIARLPARLARLTPWLAFAGLGVAAYMAYVETQMVEAVCGPIGDCNAVQSSPYAVLFGVLPIGVMGVMGYTAILAAWFWARLRHDITARLAQIAVLGMAGFGTLFSLYLTYLEPFVIRAVCAWCLTSAVIITLLMLVNTIPVMHETRDTAVR